MEIAEDRAKLLGSLLLFTMTFYKLRTGRDFVLSEPIGRESHFISICRELTHVFYLRTNLLIINVPPGHGKSELIIHFIAWSMAHYPDCNFLYISYSHELAAKHTYTIKQIINLPYYRKLFNVEIKSDSSAKDNFKTTAGGSVRAFGSAGAITGQDAGLPNLNRFSGGVFMDDMHKPDEVHSDTIRETVKRNYLETIMQRPRGPNVPKVGIGQRLHEDDLFGNLIAGFDGYTWNKVILKSIDDAGNALYPNVNSLDMLRIKQETSPYVFASQFQQNPIPAGGGIYKPEWYTCLDEEPAILATFYTVDSAETDKDYNDATVFSFWGIYRVKVNYAETNLLALHWLDCIEIRCEPANLQSEFFNFHAECLTRPYVKPMYAGVEKKSTGVTLSSVLSHTQGLQVIPIDRTRASGSKTARFFEAQPYAASKRITFPAGAKHRPLCVTHMSKITANNTHRHDDIADTHYDAVKLGLIDEVIYRDTSDQQQQNQLINTLLKNTQHINQLRGLANGSR
jgi:predicted phage terminase large subunit-like protein